MKQKELKAIPALRGAAAVVKAAATTHGAGIPLLQNTADNIGTDADALTTTCNNHEAGKVVLTNYRSVLAAMVITVRAFLTLGRDILKPLFGGDYSQAYDVLGLVGTTMIPGTVQELLVVLQAFKAYFTAHPEQEDPLHNITAARCQALYDQLLVAQNNVNTQVAAVDDLLETRNIAAEKLRKRIRGVIDEMAQLISPFDARWVAFGFNKPGALETPDIVEHLQAVLIGPNAVALKWDPSARAEYYRVFTKIHGAEGDYTAVGSPADLDFTIENLPANATIDIVVTAVNNGGESAVSEVVTITTN